MSQAVQPIAKALIDWNALSSATTATITEQNLPSNHAGNITVHAVGTGTNWSSSTTWSGHPQE